MRMNRIMVGVAVLAFAGCGDKPAGGGGLASGPEPAASAPPELTTTALELTKAFKDDPTAAAAKYGGKRVELSSTLGSPAVYPDGYVSLMLEWYPDPGNAMPSLMMANFGKTDPALIERLKGLAKGQTVTVRGTVPKMSAGLDECVLVSAGPTTALPVTPSALHAALKTEVGRKKYEHRDVVMRAEVRTADWNKLVASLVVWDVGVKDGPGLEASIAPTRDSIGKKLGAIKPGTVLILIGEAQDSNDGRIWDFRVLEAPPEGVTLPVSH